ncbi:MAG: HEAT repeat domain-containing protein [Planctomycetota bacterium]|jgi:hypothetical protein
MRKIGWSVLFAALVFAVADTAYPQVDPTYTKNPLRYSEWVELRLKAGWLLELWQQPTTTMEAQIIKVEEWGKAGRPAALEDTPEVLRFLDIQDYEVARKASQGDVALRTLAARTLVEEAEWDPVFDAIIKIQRFEHGDRVEATQAIQLLVDALGKLNGDYPPAFETAAEIISRRLEDEEAGVRFVALNAVAALPEAYRSGDLIGALVKALREDDEVIVAEAARLLGELSLEEAVRPLMERFAEIPEDSDPPSTEESPSGTSLNQARLAIAIAVGKITGNDWQFTRQINRAGVLEAYKTMLEWWDANKNSYD